MTPDGRNFLRDFFRQVSDQPIQPGDRRHIPLYEYPEVAGDVALPGFGGQVAAARAVYEEALPLRRGVVAGQDQPSRQALVELLTILRKIERIDEQTGDHAASNVLSQERQDIEKQLAASPQ